MSWARNIVVAFEMEKWTEELKANKDNPDLTLEQELDIATYIADLYMEAKAEREVLTEVIAELKESLKENNPFAKEMDLHAEVARDHMERLREAHDEL